MSDATDEVEMESQQESSAEYTFARFWRCVLQVNPAGYSAAYRGQTHGLDEDTYNQKVLEACLQLDIKVVGIADHGNVDAVDKFILVQDMVHGLGLAARAEHLVV